MPSTNTQTKISSLRLLILSPDHQKSITNHDITASSVPVPFPALLKVLTNTSPPQSINTFAGYTDSAPLHLKSKYYEKYVNIWCDILPNPSSATQQTPPDPVTSSRVVLGDDIDHPATTTLQSWQDQMTSETALEVRRAIGSIIVLLPFTTASGTSLTAHQRSRLISIWTPYIEAISILRDAIEDDTTREVGSIILLQDMSSACAPSTIKPDPISESVEASNELLEALEDECLSSGGILGWDFVSWHATEHKQSTTPVSTVTTRNKFGEKIGIARVKEVLEGVDWSASAYDDDDDEEDDNDSIDDFLTEDKISSFQAATTADSDPSLKTPFIHTTTPLAPSQTRTTPSHTDQLSTTTSSPAPQNNTTQKDPHAEVWSALDANVNNKPDDELTGTDADTSPTFEEEEEEDVQIAQLQRLMDRAVVMRERASGFATVEERERFARREVKRLMEEGGW